MKVTSRRRRVKSAVRAPEEASVVGFSREEDVGQVTGRRRARSTIWVATRVWLLPDEEESLRHERLIGVAAAGGVIGRGRASDEDHDGYGKRKWLDRRRLRRWAAREEV